MLKSKALSLQYKQKLAIAKQHVDNQQQTLQKSCLLQLIIVLIGGPCLIFLSFLSS